MALLYAIQEIPFIDFKRVASPLDTETLTIRNDERGQGDYGTSRNGGRKHRGVDLLAPLGSPVYAVRSGYVLEAEKHNKLGFYVKILHDGDVTSLYAHLSELSTEAGHRVRQGEQIGKVGKTGNADHPLIKPHLHLEVTQSGEHVHPEVLGFQLN